MSSNVQDEFNFHKECLKSVGVDWEQIESNSVGILPQFKEKLMPLIRVLRKKISMYDNFKCRAIEVSKVLLDVIMNCVEISKENTSIYNYLKSKIFADRNI